MFGLSEAKARASVLWDEIFGRGYFADKPAPYSMVERVKGLVEAEQKHRDLLEGRREAMGFYGERIPGQPPLKDRLRAIEEVLGITYEHQGTKPAKWVHKVKPKK